MGRVIINILYKVLFFYCTFSVLYLFLLAVAGRLFYRRNRFARSGNPPAEHSSTGDPVSGEQYKRIAILVPAYKEDGIILSTADNLLHLDYPRDRYDIYIIADGFMPDTLEQLRQVPVRVVEVAFEKSTKTRSLNEAFRTMEDIYDIALICDADNMLAPDFLQKLNEAFRGGARAVQGRRVAKNLDTPFAILDACSEAVNNHIFRKGSNALGLSSAVIGSGMAFQPGVLREILSRIDAVGGFDKILQLRIVGQGIRIYYLDEALIFDEKVSTAEAFGQQRRRWVSSQFIYFRQFFIPALRQLGKGNLSYFNLAVLCNAVLPRAFLLVLLPVFTGLSFLVSSAWAVAAAGVWALYLITIAISLPPGMVNRDFFRAVLKLPKAVGLMLGALFGMKRSNKTFIHTVHTKTEVTNYLYTENKQKNG